MDGRTERQTDGLKRAVDVTWQAFVSFIEPADLRPRCLLETLSNAQWDTFSFHFILAWCVRPDASFTFMKSLFYTFLTHLLIRWFSFPSAFLLLPRKEQWCSCAKSGMLSIFSCLSIFKSTSSLIWCWSFSNCMRVFFPNSCWFFYFSVAENWILFKFP